MDRSLRRRPIKPVMLDLVSDDEGAAALPWPVRKPSNGPSTPPIRKLLTFLTDPAINRGDRALRLAQRRTGRVIDGMKAEKLSAARVAVKPAAAKSVRRRCRATAIPRGRARIGCAVR